MVEAGIGHPVQRRVLGVGDQQAAAFQHAHDTPAEGVEQAVQFLAARPVGAVKGRPATGKVIGAVEEQHVQVNVQIECRTEALDQRDSAGACTGGHGKA